MPLADVPVGFTRHAYTACHAFHTEEREAIIVDELLRLVGYLADFERAGLEDKLPCAARCAVHAAYLVSLLSGTVEGLYALSETYPEKPAVTSRFRFIVFGCVVQDVRLRNDTHTAAQRLTYIIQSLEAAVGIEVWDASMKYIEELRSALLVKHGTTA